MSDSPDTNLSSAYRRAGQDFLAGDLESMFRVLKTDEDIALHNHMVKKMVRMVGQDKAQVNLFYRTVAHRLLQKKTKRSFLKLLGEVITSERTEL